LAGVLLLAGLLGVGMVATRQSWNPGFAYLAIMIELFVINFLSVAIWNHVLIGRRIGVKSGTKGWDYAVMLLGFTPGVFGMYVAAWWQNEAVGLAPIDTLWWVALLILGLGWAFANWSMIVNPFFEKTVRIQSEHGHQVVDSGPYRLSTAVRIDMSATPATSASSPGCLQHRYCLAPPGPGHRRCMPPRL
jgi:hypothetical protein